MAIKPSQQKNLLENQTNQICLPRHGQEKIL